MGNSVKMYAIGILVYRETGQFVAWVVILLCLTLSQA